MNQKQYKKELKKIKAMKCTNNCKHCRALRSLKRRARFELLLPMIKAYSKVMMAEHEKKTKKLRIKNRRKKK